MSFFSDNKYHVRPKKKFEQSNDKKTSAGGENLKNMESNFYYAYTEHVRF